MNGSNSGKINPSNRLKLDYMEEALRFQKYSFPIIDVHSHINGSKAAEIYFKVSKAYGVSLTYSMTHVEDLTQVKKVMGEQIRFIATPDFTSTDLPHALGRGFIDRLKIFNKAGAKIAKFWAAPRGRDFGAPFGRPDLFLINSPHRIETMRAAQDLGMIFMAHIADPDTWFKSKYRDSSMYGTKQEQYDALHEVLEQFTQPWILAHMGGWPEDLAFLSNLLEQHANVYLDSSATKWMVRELSKHPRNALIEFFTKWKGRILFGSDIVVSEVHLNDNSNRLDSSTLSTNSKEALDLYASRYWALRTLYETDFSGESPIADPDLSMTAPEQYTSDSAPLLNGKQFPLDLLQSLYFDAAHSLLDPLYQ